MASPALMSRICVLEAKLSSGAGGGNSGVSDDKLKSIVSENEELKKKVNSLETLIKEVSKKAETFKINFMLNSERLSGYLAQL